MKPLGYVRDYVKDPITREELVREVQYCKERLEQAEKKLKKFDKENKNG